MSRADDLLATLPPANSTATVPGGSRVDQLLANLPPASQSGGRADELLSALPPKNSFKSKVEMAKFVWGETPWAKAYGLAQKPAEMSKKGLKQLAGMVPEPTALTSKIKNQSLRDMATVTLGAPKVGAEVLAEMAPSFISPDALALQGGGQILGRGASAVAGSKLAKAVAAKTPEAVKRAFTWRYKQPHAEVAEQRITNIQNAGEDATEIGQALQNKLSNAEQIRIGQIAHGGVSVSQKELPLRLRANYARQALDKLEQEAKALDLIPENALANFTRKELAALRTKKAALDNRIRALRDFNKTRPKAAPPEDPMPVVAGQAKYQGEPRAAFSYNSDMNPEGKMKSMYTIFGDPKNPAIDVAKGGSGNTTQTIDWFQKRGIPIKGIEDRAAAKGWKPLDYPTPPAAAAAKPFKGPPSPKQKALDAVDKLKIQGLTGVVRKVEKAQGATVQMKSALDEAKDLLSAEEFAGLEGIMSQEAMRRSAGLTRMVERFEKSSIGKQESLFARLAKVAERGGAKIDDILESTVSIGNFKNLIKRIEAIPNRFPGQGKMIRELEGKSQDIQGRLVDYYQNSGKKYMPRLYTKHELPGDEELGKFGFKNTKIIRDQFRKRAYLPEDLRVQMGEIKQPAYPVSKGLADTAQAVETEKMYRRVAANPRWTSSVPKEGFVELPKSKNYGSLAGKHVHPEIARDLTEMHAAKDKAEKVYDKAIGMWKFGKVVLNPATHFRNVMSNSILADLGGMGHDAQLKFIPKAANEVLKRGPVYEQARKMGLIGGEFFGAEIKAFRDNLVRTPGASIIEKAGGIAGRVGNKIGNVYQAEEQVFKLGKFMHNLEKGMDAKAAAADAEKWLFNYAKVSPAINAIRKKAWGAPFVTFTAKALPRIAEAATQNPMRVYKYMALFKAMDKVSQERLGLTDEDMATIKRNTRGQSVVLPTKDATGAPYVLDLSFILPWGDIGESGGMFGLPPAAPPAGPLKAFVEAGLNKSQFRATHSPNNSGQIYDPETDFGHQKAAKVSDYLLKTAAPSFTPGIPGRNSPFKGGYSYDKIKSAVQKKPDYFGRVRPLSATVADTVFGLKATPKDPALLRSFERYNKKKAIDDMARQMASQMRHKGISPEEKKEIRKEFFEKLRRMKSGVKATL